MLDQSDIDALLSSAETLPSDESAAQPRARAPAAPIPRDYELTVSAKMLRRILPLRVPIVVRLAERTLPLADIVQIGAGTIIEFDKAADADLDLLINEVTIGTGNAVKCGERFGLHVIRIQPWIQRIISEGLYR